MRTKRISILKYLTAICLILSAFLSYGQTSTTQGDVSKSPKSADNSNKDKAEPLFATPPVPKFMLEKQTKPLSKEEMMEQARAAEQAAKKQQQNVNSKP
jgi:hypothetical protein